MINPNKNLIYKIDSCLKNVQRTTSRGETHLKIVICDNHFFLKGTNLFNFIQDNACNTPWNKINDLGTSIKF
jgi:hypothetical protein